MEFYLPYNMKNIAVLILAFLASKGFFTNGLEFNRDYVGVNFWPYPKNSENGMPKPSRFSYNFENLKTMLQVVSTKFSKVLLLTMDTFAKDYVERDSYRFESTIMARTAEAAAVFNRERNNKSLTVLLGVYRYEDNRSDGRNTATEFKVALEAARTADALYPGTVEGIVFFVRLDLGLLAQSWIPATIHLIKNFKHVSKGRPWKVGLFYSCSEFHNLETSPNSNTIIAALKREILPYLDIFICPLTTFRATAKFGVHYAVRQLLENFRDGRSGIRKINKNTTVMIQTGWQSDEIETQRDVNNMREYVNIMNTYATESKVTIWVREAFDTNSTTIGWWKLERNDLVNNASGYIERISGKPVQLENLLPQTSFPRLTEKTTTEIPNHGRDENKHSVNDENWIWIVIAMGAVLAVALVAALCIFLCKFYRKLDSVSEALTKQDIRDFKFGVPEPTSQDAQIHELAMKMPYDQSLEISKQSFDILWDEVLGTGEYGSVHKAVLKSGKIKEVALKTAKRDCPTFALKGILSEIKVLSYLGRHPNIAALYGAYTAELDKGTVYMVTELCAMGSLKKYLINCQTNVSQNELVVNFKDLVRWSHEIANGMEYIGQIKGVVHADIAARNVLLSSDRCAKIIDFGLSRRLYDYANYSKRQQEPLPWRWMSIESLKFLEFSVKSDVWSYGVTLWEIFSLGDQPFPGLSWNADFIQRLENGLRMMQPRLATPELYATMCKCWELAPEDRLTFTDLKQQTRDFFDAVNNTDSDT